MLVRLADPAEPERRGACPGCAGFWPIALRTCVSFTARGLLDLGRRLDGLGRAATAARLLGDEPRLARARGTGSTSVIVLPRILATSSGRRSFFRPSTVAFAMLIGFVVPRLFASTSRIPASSSTARTPPPAMTPVPSEAGPDEAPGGVERAEDLVRDVVPCFGHGEEVLLRVVDGLRDRERNLARLAVADADAVDLVADHDQRREREAPAALDDLGDAVDLDHALLELADFLAGDHFTLDGRSKLQSSLARAVGERLDASVVQVAAAVEHDGLDRRPSWRRRRQPCRPRRPARSCCP